MIVDGIKEAFEKGLEKDGQIVVRPHILLFSRYLASTECEDWGHDVVPSAEGVPRGGEGGQKMEARGPERWIADSEPSCFFFVCLAYE